MSYQNKVRVLLYWLILLFGLAFSLTLTSCRGNSSIKGKWVQVSGSPIMLVVGGPGALWEFFDDGTVSIEVGFLVNSVAGEYSWPDDSHLKIGFSQTGGAGSVGVVYEFSRSGDKITLKDPSTGEEITLRRYKELTPSPKSLAGTWEQGSIDNSECFRGLGLEETPQRISFGEDGTVSIQQRKEESLFGVEASLHGQFSVSDGVLHVTAKGTRGEEQIGGELQCQVTVSHFRLLFKDKQGAITVFVRKQR